MLRDRISNMKNVDIALKYCKAKERWLDHVYDNFINVYIEQKDRYEAVRIMLGASSKDRIFDFHSTILWDNLDNYDTEYWKAVESWVIWFEENSENIVTDIKSGATFGDIALTYGKNIDNPTEFAKYLINNLS